jgi:hypothetical protein
MEARYGLSSPMLDRKPSFASNIESLTPLRLVLMLVECSQFETFLGDRQVADQRRCALQIVFRFRGDPGFKRLKADSTNGTK